MDVFRIELAKALTAETGLSEEQIMGLIEVPPNPSMGDFAFPVFALAKRLKKAPALIAKDMAPRMAAALGWRVEANGPYVNFFVDKAIAGQKVLEAIAAHGACHGTMALNGRMVMVEFCSPNTNKPLHLGHLRNIFLGESVSRLLEGCGNKVVRSCVVNDRGIHIMKSMLAYRDYGDGKAPDKKPDHFVGDYYVLFSRKASENPALEEAAQGLLRLWEQGDPSTIALWKKMNAWVYEGFAATYKELGVSFDRMYYESDYYREGKDIVADGIAHGLFAKDQGAVIAPLEKYGLPNKVLIRSDGTSLYMTQDLYLAKKKFSDYPLSMSVYVVGNEQNLHFEQLFKILELLGNPWAHECHHLNYGMVNLPEGKMKSREGTVVDADDIIAEMRALAGEEITKRHPDLTKPEVEARSRAIGDGALRFFILKMDPFKDMVYDPKLSISFEGETGPYVQYTHARLCSILRKAVSVPAHVEYGQLTEAREQQMVMMLSRYPSVMGESARNLKPSTMCRYLLDLSQLCNGYYHDVPVLQAEPAVRDARLALMQGVAQVIKNGLALLGIEAPEAM